MPAAVAVKFGSTDITSYVDDFRPSGDARIHTYTIPRKDGVYFDEGKLNPMKVEVSGSIRADTQTALRTALDSFMTAMLNGRQNLYLWDDRYIPSAQCNRFSYAYEKGMCMLRFKLTFIGGTPFFVATAASTDAEIIAATPTTYTVNNTGGAYALPIITIAADQTVNVPTVVLENLTTEEEFTYSAQINAGESLIIDCTEFTVANNLVSDLTNFSGDFMKLAAGNNSIRYTGANCTITFDWYDRWF